VATWEDAFEQMLVRLDDEIMAKPLSFEEKLYQRYKEEIRDFSSIVVGPGMGTGERSSRLLKDLLDFYHGPIVIDADGINQLADPEGKKLLLARKGPTVLTPHPGEMARLMGVSKKEVLGDPIRFVTQAAEELNAIVLVKGATTFISAGDGHLFLNHYPNDGMATAGSGDVLAGMIGGIIGQGMKARDAVCLGVFMHSLSGRLAADRLGHRSMTSSDIIHNLGEAFLKLRAQRERSASQ
jgi:NAD(P)H-hydrate epimerase